MKLFDVYPLYPIEPVKAQGCYLWDKEGNQYLDLYGGHAVISIGHSHPRYVSRISEQLQKIGFYSNSVQNSLQLELAEKLGEVSKYEDCELFLCSSGAEANENALKLASFHTGKSKVLAVSGAFHGRTSGVVAATDNPKIVAPYNANHNVEFIPFNDVDILEEEFDEQVAAIIIEGVQGVAGVFSPMQEFLSKAQALCETFGALLILDEVQSGAGRTGKYFAHQHFNVQPDVITLAKGMGNGFPVASVLISPKIKPWAGMLGTTFGGNHLACAAALAVLEITCEEKLMKNASIIGEYAKEQLLAIDQVNEVRGEGLMLGASFEFPIAELRKKLLMEHRVFTGSAADKNTLRILPPLNIQKEHIDHFITQLKIALA